MGLVMSIPSTGHTHFSWMRCDKSRHGRGPSARPRAHGRERCEDQFARSADPARVWRRRSTSCSTARAGRRTTFAGEHRTKPSSTATTANSATAARSRISPPAWTRTGLGDAGYAEQLEFLGALAAEHFSLSLGQQLPGMRGKVLHDAETSAEDHQAERPCGVKALPRRHAIVASRTARRWTELFIGMTSTTSWRRCQGWRERAADPFNDHEPVDSSAARSPRKACFAWENISARPRAKPTRRPA